MGGVERCMKMRSNMKIMFVSLVGRMPVKQSVMNCGLMDDSHRRPQQFIDCMKAINAGLL